MTLCPSCLSPITSKLPGSGHHAHSSEQGDDRGRQVQAGKKAEQGACPRARRRWLSDGSGASACAESCAPEDLSWNLCCPTGAVFSVPEAPLAGMLAYDPQRDARPLSRPFLMAEEAAGKEGLFRGREEHPVLGHQQALSI